jgi:tetratricopeptide (TPR) repeat protein
LHVADGPTLAAFAGAAPVQTDDRTALEFSAPLTLYARTGLALVDRLRKLAAGSRQPPAVAAALGSSDADSWRQRAEMYVAAEAYGPAFDAASRALALDPGSSAADVLVKAAVPLNRTDAVVARLEQIAGQPQAALASRIALSRLRATRGDLEGAIRTAADAVDAPPESPAAWEQLASVLGDVADPDRLATAVAELTRRTPNGWAAAYYAATVAFLRGDFAGAAALGERAAGLQASDGRALNLVGAARASLGDVANARRAFEGSLDRDARDPASYVNLARLELGAGNAARAAALFSEALVLDPASRDARDGLDSAQRLR